MIHILTNEQRIAAFSRLGTWLLQGDRGLHQLTLTVKNENAWFTPQAVSEALLAIGNMLNEADLRKWIAEDFTDRGSEIINRKSVGLILAGNIPLVGFHDVLAVLAAGHHAQIKLSSQDRRLLPFLLNKLIEIEPGFGGTFKFVERLEGFDAVIATGSNNSSRYFDYYFSKVPSIIRRNRNSAAVLNGNETTGQLSALGHDIFDYFGLGCRNVSKLFVPSGYDFNHFFESIQSFQQVIDHHKYNNNYDYNKSILLVNGDKHLDNGFLLLKEDTRTASPLATVYFQEYNSEAEILSVVQAIADDLQCIVSAMPAFSGTGTVSFGESQHPKLWDYADNVNTAAFLYSL